MVGPHCRTARLVAVVLAVGSAVVVVVRKVVRRRARAGRVSMLGGAVVDRYSSKVGEVGAVVKFDDAD